MAKTRMAANTGRSMMSSTRGGFTIIEVVLVLAIAGLIFLMVFIALPALQRSQRDTQRRTDVGRMTEVITQYQTNNNGRLPADGKVDPIPTNSDGNVVINDVNGGGDVMMCNGKPDAEGVNSEGPACNLIKYYLNAANSANNEYLDPDGYAYGINISTYSDSVTMPGYDHTIYIYKGAQCDGESVKKSSNTRDYVVVYRLESSGLYCQDNGGGAAGNS